MWQWNENSQLVEPDGTRHDIAQAILDEQVPRGHAFSRRSQMLSTLPYSVPYCVPSNTLPTIQSMAMSTTTSILPITSLAPISPVQSSLAKISLPHTALPHMYLPHTSLPPTSLPSAPLLSQPLSAPQSQCGQGKKRLRVFQNLSEQP